LVQAALVAVLINAVLLAAAAQLVRERPQAQDMTVPTVVSLVNVPRDETPPEPERRREPEPPKEKPRLDFAPELPSASLTSPDLSGPAVVLDRSLFDVAPPMGAMIFEAGDLDRPPRTVVRTPPQYPYRARQRGIEGSATVRFLVSADGTTSDITVLSSEPAGVFDQAVVDAVARWRFEPGMLAGEPVAAWVVTPITFDLGESR
jgi:protein TonB